ncbi:MAG: hypothetical protein AB2L20_27830 [Mangrovibacterium sp.]
MQDHIKPISSFYIAPKDLALWNEEMQLVTEPGKFKLMFARSAEDVIDSKNNNLSMKLPKSGFMIADIRNREYLITDEPATQQMG